MRHPEKFSRALGLSYGITFAIDVSMGVIGYLMFGKYVFEEVKSFLRIGQANLDNTIYSRHKRVPRYSQLSRRLNHSHHPHNQNAPQHPSHLYYSRHSPRSLPHIPPPNLLSFPSSSSWSLPRHYSHGDGRTPGIDSYCVPRL